MDFKYKKNPKTKEKTNPNKQTKRKPQTTKEIFLLHRHNQSAKIGDDYMNK